MPFLSLQKLRDPCVVFADFLEARTDEIVAAWRREVELDERITSNETLSDRQFRDHIPAFLSGLAKLFRQHEHDAVATTLKENAEENAEVHGQVRWLQGYSLTEVLLEIDAFRKILLIDCIHQFALEHPGLSARKRRLLKNMIYEYSRQLVIDSAVQFSEARDLENRQKNQQLTELNARLDKANADLRREAHKVEQLSLRDPLTEVGNRRHLQSQLDQLIRRSARYQESLSIVMVDLDHFKSVNDRFGHSMGDTVLKCVAQLLVHFCRDTDVVSRFGGEEFCLLLPRTTLCEAEVFIERLRARLSDGFPEAEAVTVTASFGVAQWEPEQSSEVLVANADEALYAAKAAGRNCVKVHTPADCTAPD